jgi:hypothetical protein
LPAFSNPFFYIYTFLGTFIIALPNFPQKKAAPSFEIAAAPDSPAEIFYICLSNIIYLNLVFSIWSSRVFITVAPRIPHASTLPLLVRATVNKAPHAMSTTYSSLLSKNIF